MTAPRCLWPTADAKAVNERHMRTQSGDLIRLNGASVTDECFTHGEYGTFNIAKIMRHIRRKKIDDAGLYKFEMSSEILHHIKQRDIDEATLANMPIQRMYDPCLAMRHDQLTDIMDGAHRIIRLAQLDMKHFYAWVISRETAEKYRVRFERRHDGVWSEIMPDELLKLTWGKHGG